MTIDSTLWCQSQADRWALDRFTDPDCGVVAEAIQALEPAGLLRRGVDKDYAEFEVGLTRLGRRALADDIVRQHLGLGDVPPAT